jgi:NADH dehydrogenase [ubiquinone] 1 alpha subcomplex assembly factor 6
VRDGCWDVGTRGMDEVITVRKELKGSGGKVVPSSVMPLFLSAVCGIIERRAVTDDGVDPC